MRNKLMITVAAVALLAVPGLVAAQQERPDTGSKMAPPAAAQQSQQPSGQMPEAQTQRQQPGADDADRDRPRTPGAAQRSQQPGSEQDNQRPRGTAQDRQDNQQPRGTAQDRQDSQQPRGTAQDRQKRQRDTAQDKSKPSAKAQLSEKQRGRIRERITRSRPHRVTNVDFNIRIGTRVPRSFRLVALPAPIIEIVPAYRGYLYFVVEDELVIVEPGTLRIVAVIPV